MRIGIVGSEGIVGGAVKFGMEKLGHEVFVHDILIKDSKIDNIYDTDIVFICVPTPSNEDGSCDVSIVESVVEEIVQRRIEEPYETRSGYKRRLKKQIIAVKSTLAPGTLNKLIYKYSNPSYGDAWVTFAFVPEFLRERCAVTDFTENHDLLVIGCNSKETFETIKEAHGKLPKNVVHLTPEEAELVKLYNNAFNATRITFANAFYDICKSRNINYTNVKNAVVNIRHIPDFYLDVNENFRGFGGMCLPKDMRSLVNISKGIESKFFERVLEENDRYKVTVLPGMRKK